MLTLLWDVSALAKRYSLEVGSETVDALFDHVSITEMVATFLGYAETYSTLLRKRNRGDITVPTFQSAASLLQAEVLDSTDFGLLTVDNAAVLGGIEQMERHNLNSSDAAILTAFLTYSRAGMTIGSRYLLVASDRRMVRAATAEGLATLDPEQVDSNDVPAQLSRLS